jgi:hypothetical protein
MTRIVTFALVAAAVLAGTADAAKKPGRIGFAGPATIVGPGPVRGAVKATAGAAPVTFVANGKGGIALVDRAGDLKVECAATGGATTKQTKRGKTVVVCKGDATVTGSGFAFAVRGRTYKLTIPAGYTGRARSGRAAKAGAKAGTTASDPSVAAADAALGQSGS